ncbi:MAG: right-handed parallel beta-helix repeat-containing protein, partial [Planctomycetes bacterium]|nr:right-handed parallel beta-helix repeat-containing protein [Planctomycetota bacterium]
MKQFAFSLILTILVPSLAPADIINVPADQPTIQAAIDAALLGDEVVVADGIYTGAGNKNLDFAGKQITVRSANGPENCIIDCENDGRGFTFHSGESLLSVVEGFTITNGLAIRGGAIACQASSPTITNMFLHGNVADGFKKGEDGGFRGGGAIHCVQGSSPIIQLCTIVNNVATIGTGGGVHCSGSTPTILRCTIMGNAGLWGGGIHCSSRSSALVLNCVLSGNMAQEWGGGIGISGGGGSQFINCTITNNSAGQDGGGLFASQWEQSPALIRNCTIANNSATDAGGGLFLKFSSNPLIANSILWGNEAPIGSQIAVSSANQTSPPTMAYS